MKKIFINRAAQEVLEEFYSNWTPSPYKWPLPYLKLALACAETGRSTTDRYVALAGRALALLSPFDREMFGQTYDVPALVLRAVDELPAWPLPKAVVTYDGSIPVSEELQLEFKTSRINAERDLRIAYGFLYSDKIFQARPEDIENIGGAATAALAAIGNGALPGNMLWHGGASDFVWIAKDNSLVPMDAQTTLSFGLQAMSHKQTHIFAARALKDMDPEPEDYTLDAYWPAVPVEPLP